MTLYLVHLPGYEGRAEFDLDADWFQLSDDLFVFDADLTPSKLYHRIKWNLNHDGPLLVAPMDGRPKFKGMRPGALKWLQGVPH